jgi:hypothetical protein
MPVETVAEELYMAASAALSVCAFVTCGRLHNTNNAITAGVKNSHFEFGLSFILFSFS